MNTTPRRIEIAHSAIIVSLLVLAGCAPPATTDSYEFVANFSHSVDRPWIGADFYANRFQDWRIHNGRAEAIEGRVLKPMRTLQLLTHVMSEAEGDIRMSVRMGPVEGGRESVENTWSGFLIGAGGDAIDYRISALVHHWPGEDGGLIVGVDGSGEIIVRDNSQRGAYKGNAGTYETADWPLVEPFRSSSIANLPDDIDVEMHASPGDNGYNLHVSVKDVDGNLLGESEYQGVPAHQFSGNVALVSHNSPNSSERGYWFSDWNVSGSKIVHHAERGFGPVVGVQYTLSRGVLKLTAQMAPLGDDDEQAAELQVLRDNEWITVATSSLIKGSYTIPFRVEDWSSSTDVKFRVAYKERKGLDFEATYYNGRIRSPDPVSDEFVLGVLNCNNISSGVDMQWNRSTIWHPHEDLLAAVKSQSPDMVFFAGDQLYEKGLAGIDRTPSDVAHLDYHYHWFRFLWAFGDLTRDMPTVAIPDDHDVYHGNIWGEGGKAATGNHDPQHDNGGYIMDPEWVNSVHRTQTSHLPDPIDPTPIKQGISVYYTDLNYAGMSFAVIADRMWKSAPKDLLPEAKIWNGWIESPEFDPHESDVPDATLLGERQLQFLDDWTEDWSGGAWMKVVLSATPFTNVATLPGDAMNDAVVPDLVYPEPGEYVAGDKSVADMDSNGWPQTGREKALRTIRKGFAFHVVGDQHLSSFIQYGIDDWRDAGFAFVSPAIANFWPRRWFPPTPGANREAGAPEYTGDHLDGFGNKLTVSAVANPLRSGREPAALYDRSPGYGVVKFSKSDRSITAESWPRWVDPATSNAQQYPGWPITVSQQDNFSPDAAGHLPLLRITGLQNAVVKVMNEATKETVYSLRINGYEFRPPVYADDTTYRIDVHDPDLGLEQRYDGVAIAKDHDQVIQVSF